MGEDLFVLIRFFTRAAMPCLIIVFGFMLFHIYFDKFKEDREGMLLKLSKKMSVCYFAFVSLSFIGFFFGVNGFPKFLASLAMVGPATYANLFKYYFFLFPVAVLFILIQIRHGWRGVSLVVIFFWLVAELISHFVSLPFVFQHIGGLFFGIDDAWGPSIAHVSVLLLFGMALASIFKSGLRFGAGGFFSAFVIVVLALLIISYEMANSGYVYVMQSVVEYRAYRASNHVAYFSYAILMFLILWVACALFINIFSFFGARFVGCLTYFGRHTFSLFFIGNSAILLLPRANVSPEWGLVSGAFVMAFSLLGVYFFKRYFSKTAVWQNFYRIIQAPPGYILSITYRLKGL